MKISFLKIAQSELDDAFDYYESTQKGLGFRFQSEVANAISRITQFPKIYQAIGRYSHRCLIHKFPYGIIYQIRGRSNQILVVAIAHLHRKPDYWYSREYST
ncbi:MAG: type II toxin-antitoxin system RelE/ParE family toxin, partial [Pseudomonadota bacterium]